MSSRCTRPARCSSNEAQSALLADIKHFLDAVARDAEWKHNNASTPSLIVSMRMRTCAPCCSGRRDPPGETEAIWAVAAGAARRTRWSPGAIRSHSGDGNDVSLGSVSRSVLSRLRALHLANIADKVTSGIRLSFDDGVRLSRCPDLHAPESAG